MYSRKFFCARDMDMSLAANNSEESHPGHSNPGVFTSSSRIVDLQQNRSGALLRQIETLCAADKARNNTVLGRLGQQRPFGSPSFQRPASSIRKWTVRSTDDEEESYCEGDWVRSPLVCSDDILSSTSTPTELREIPLITTPDNQFDWPDRAQVFAPYRPSSLPPVNPRPCRRASRLPVMQMNFTGAEKVVSGGYRLQTAKGQVDKVQKGLANLHNASFSQLQAAQKRKGLLPPIYPGPPQKHPAPPQKHPAPPQKHPAPPQKHPAPPQKHPAPPQKHPALPQTPAPTNTTKSRVAHLQPPPAPPKQAARPFKPSPPKKLAPRPPPAVAARKTSSQRAVKDYSKLEDLKPLRNPSECLSKFFKLINDEDWQKKTEGLKMMQALVQHHPETLMVKLHEVSYAVTEEIKNLRSSVAALAVDTMVYLYTYLQTAMDVQAEKTGQALLLKIAQATVNTFLQQQVSMALGVLVQCCSPAPVLNALLHTGLNHLCPAVRESAAQQLRLMADNLGAEAIMTAGKTFTERFLVAVNKAAVDPSGKVRPHGLTILQELMYEENFLDLWNVIVPDKDRPFLEKNLRKMRRT